MRHFALAAVASVALAAAYFALRPSHADAQVYYQDTGKPVNTGAQYAATQIEWLPGVAVTTLTSAQTLQDRKTIAFQNLSSATISLGFDATSPTSTGSLGYKLAPGDTASFDFGSGIAVRAVATAATATTAGLQVLQAK